MADGIKISQLTEKTDGLNRSDFIVVDHGENGNYSTFKAKLATIQGVFNQNATEALEKITELEDQIRNVKTNIDTIDAIVTTISTYTTLSVNDMKDTLDVAYYNSNIALGEIDELSSNTNEKIEELRNLINDFGDLSDSSKVEAIFNLVNMLSGEDISFLINSISTDVLNVSGTIETISASLFNRVTAISSALSGQIDDLKDSVYGAYFKTNRSLVNNDNNPIDCNTPGYSWYDRYCFNSFNADGTSLSVNGNSIISIDQNEDLCAMPGIETFKIAGLPIRSGMFNNNRALTLSTTYDCYAELYLNNAAFYTNADTVLSMSINNELIARRKMLSSVAGSDLDLQLVWSGLLEWNSKISFAVENNGSAVSTYNLVGAIVASIV